MAQDLIPEIPAGKLDRDSKLFALAFLANAAAIAFGHAFGAGLGFGALANAAAPAALVPLLGLQPGASLARRVGCLLASVALLALTVIGASDAVVVDFTAPAGAATVQLWSVVGVALALAVGVPLWYFARLIGHPSRGVRLAAQAGIVALVVTLLASLVERRMVDDWLVPGYAAATVLAFLAARRALRRWWDMQPARGTKLSVSLICRDEADRIGRTLESVHGWADEIVVLDSGSTDGTVEVARRYTDKVWVTDWPGFGPQKQRALERCTNEWVLSIDADEVPSAELKREIDAWLATHPAEDGFKLLRGSFVLGASVDFGAEGDHHVRLFRRDRTRFDGQPVHEDVIVTGRIGRLESPLWHFTCRDLAHLQRKLSGYANIRAHKRFQAGKRATIVGALVRGTVNFVITYIWRLGFLDGRNGLLMAGLYANYTFEKYAVLWALSRKPPSP